MKSMFTICFAMLVFVSSHAQQVAEDTTVYLDEALVTANKFPESRSKIAQQVFSITPAQMKLMNTQTTADLLSSTGMVAMQKSQQGGGSPQIRGFEASRVLLVIDGVRMNNLIYRAGHLQNIITTDNNSFEKVDILFGPSSTVYGSDALGGVIHLQTKGPTLSATGKLQINGNALFRYGTANHEKTTHVNFNIGGKQFASFTSLTYSDFDDLKMGERENSSYGKPYGMRPFFVERSADNTADVLVPNSDPYVQKFSGYSQYDIVQKFLYKPSGRLSHLLNIQYSNSSNVPRYDRLTDPDGTGLRSAEWYYGPQERLMLSYKLSATDVGKLADQMVSMVSYQAIKESRHDRRFNRPNRRNQIEDVDVVGVTIDLLKAIEAKHNLRYGFDGQFSAVNSTAFNQHVITGEKSPVATRYPDGGNRMNSLALYATHTFSLNDKVTFNDGIRIGYSRLRATFNDKTFFPFPFDEVDQKNTYASGSLGVIVAPTQRWKLSLLGSTGYRVPNVDDLAKVFDTNAGNALIVPNPDIKPEKTINVDVGITKHFSDIVRWENTFYYTRFFDAIVMDAFTFNGQSTVDYNGTPTPVLANQNTGKAKILGASSVLSAQITRHISLDGSYHYTYGRVVSEEEESPLDHIPPSFGRANIAYRDARWNASAFVNFNGWKRLKDYRLNSEDNEVYATEKGMPSWYTINLRVAYAFHQHFTLQGGVDNLLDLQYRTFASGINAPGRNIFGTLRFSF